MSGLCLLLLGDNLHACQECLCLATLGHTATVQLRVGTLRHTRISRTVERLETELDIVVNQRGLCNETQQKL